MIDGHRLVDAHVHAARLPTYKQAWHDWAQRFGDAEVLGRVPRRRRGDRKSVV